MPRTAPEQAGPSPWRFGGLSPAALARRVYAKSVADDVLDRAAGLSYYCLLASFPTLLFLTALLGLLPLPGLMERLLRYGDRVLPPEVSVLLARTLAEVVRGAGGGLISAGVVGALWAASRGVRSVIVALNVVHGAPPPRAWWRRQVAAVGLTLAFSLFILTALIVLAFGERIGAAVAAAAGLGGTFRLGWRVAQWPLAVAVGIVGVDLTYYLAPAVRPRWAWVTPGSVLAVLGWLLSSIGLRTYVASVADYNATYGSIGAVILLMLWLYLSGVALLVGAQLNVVIAHAAEVSAIRTRATLGPAPPGRGR